MMDRQDDLISAIYDCAINPGLWPDTLLRIRDSFQAAYCMVTYTSFPTAVFGTGTWEVKRNTPWDEKWLDMLPAMLPLVPGGKLMLELGSDQVWTQYAQVSDAEFQQTDFYKLWAAPQQLRDCLNTTYLMRPGIIGSLSVPRANDRPLYTEDDCQRAMQLSPHIRRAMLINEMVDAERMASALYGKLLNTLGTPVLVIGHGQRIIFANEAAEALLRDGSMIQSQKGQLSAPGAPQLGATLSEALARAEQGDSAMALTGIGIPLSAVSDVRAAAYVLPIAGNDLRRELGAGFAAVFIATRGDRQPVIEEILRTLFALSPTEARVAAAIALGNSPAAIATAQNISVNTVRSHLARAFAKTGTRDQTELSARIHQLSPNVKKTAGASASNKPEKEE